jgi:hypothetical protein
MIASQEPDIGSKVCPRTFGSKVCPLRTNYGFSNTSGLRGKWRKGDRWGLNPQPLEPQSRALPIELRSPQALLYTVSIANPLSIVNRYEREESQQM